MKTLSFWRKSMYSALVFFGTLMVLSVGYAVLSNGLSNADKVGSGSGLTASSWNHIIDGIFELDTRTANIFSSGGNVGIGVSPSTKFDILNSYTSNTGYAVRIRDTTGVSLNFGGTAGGNKWLQAQDSAGASTYYNINLNPLGGNVGIGTVIPWYKLDITGDMRLSGKLHTDAVWILTTATSLGININGGGYGGAALLMCSRNHAAGNNTYVALYMLRYGYDGNNYSTSLVSGTDFIAFSIDGTGNLFANQTSGGNATCSIFTNK